MRKARFQLGMVNTVIPLSLWHSQVEAWTNAGYAGLSDVARKSAGVLGAGIG